MQNYLRGERGGKRGEREEREEEGEKDRGREAKRGAEREGGV